MLLTGEQRLSCIRIPSAKTRTDAESFNVSFPGKGKVFWLTYGSLLTVSEHLFPFTSFHLCYLLASSFLLCWLAKSCARFCKAYLEPEIKFRHWVLIRKANLYHQRAEASSF
jgi:hypothetical protein